VSGQDSCDLNSGMDIQCGPAAMLEDLNRGLARISELPDRALARLTTDELDQLRRIGWHLRMVKLEMEIRGENQRLNRAAPQQFMLESR